MGYSMRKRSLQKIGRPFMNLPKPKRLVKKKMLAEVRTQPCAAPGKVGTNFDPIDGHHLTNKGARGGDTEDNVIPLLRSVHTQWHAKGLSWVLERYPKVRDWLVKHGRFDEIGRA